MQKYALKRKQFDINTSLAIKGIAILMMLFHHMFRNGLNVHENYSIIYYPFPEINMCNIATVFKICVALFTFVSGYGLYLNYKKTTLSNNNWIMQREIKLLSSFWFVLVLCWIICWMINGYPQHKYFDENIYVGIAYIFTEFFGCAKLLGTPTLVAEWWYVSAAVVFVFLLPFICKFEDKFLLLLLIVISLPRMLGIGFLGGTGIYSFLFAFLLGVVCAKYDLINKWLNFKCGNLYLKFVAELMLVVLGYKFWRKIPINIFWEFHYGLYPLLVIVFAAEFIAYLPMVREILVFLGKHSANIYFVHALFLYIYLSDFIYQKPYFLISYALLLIISLATSVLIEWIKKILRYENWIYQICRVLKTRV